MAHPDLNLLLTLDVLLTEGNVARAAKRLNLSASAMSRALARLRETTGDPLLVRAGRGLVPTPRALELRESVGALVQQAEAALSPVKALDLKKLARTFTVRTNEGFVENFGPALLARVDAVAPGVRLRFVPKPDKDTGPLRDGLVDLETAVVGATYGPEVRVRALFRDRFVGVVRLGHLLAEGAPTVQDYADSKHVHSARQLDEKGPVDGALAELGLARMIRLTVGGFSAALALARATDMVATVPERHTGNLRDGMHSFALPFEVPPFTVSLLWHPRMEADLAHRWLRECFVKACGRDLT
ncbi:LysR family transcriptional regulator [Hydrogenophaga sp. BPS33]|uniref:LysR family transcriptional regulator n=1 Tax=Hydrogenophaga sp. BPS33 TaxID=2651974 RepID=UPI0013204E65|nr:LysR family transcriptional regulator [Hydrogenophaga sp. BPS33]QHE84659.1 LysR family transcriptional regulator [Hydrogenophaga sp. BPS33]